MIERRFDIAISVVFLIIGVLATWNTIQLQTYINETLPRDTEQEQCQSETINVLRNWVDERLKRDDSLNVRDAAIARVVDKLVIGQKPTPEDLEAWRDAIAADQRVRLHATSSNFQLPDCARP